MSDEAKPVRVHVVFSRYAIIPEPDWIRLEASGPVQLTSDLRHRAAMAMADLGILRKAMPELPAARAQVAERLTRARKLGQAYSQALEQMADQPNTNTADGSAGLFTRLGLAAFHTTLEAQIQNVAHTLEALRSPLGGLRRQGRWEEPEREFAREMRAVYRAAKGRRGGWVRFVIVGADIVGCTMTDSSVWRAFNRKSSKR